VDLLAVQPTLDFYSALAVVYPVLFLAAMVEQRLSATTTTPPWEGSDAVVVSLTVFIVTCSVVVVGEVAALDALWDGHGSGLDAALSLVSVVVLAGCLLWPLWQRLRTTFRLLDPRRRALALVARGLARPGDRRLRGGGGRDARSVLAGAPEGSRARWLLTDEAGAEAEYLSGF
jgi:hypothetical protein